MEIEKYYMQKTLADSVFLKGIGVHSGKETKITINPARENHGIKFQRIDLPGTQSIQALFKHVVDTSLSTVIGVNGAIVSTIEHLMASFAGLGIDNALIEVDEYEIPIMDGSAKIFTSKIKEAGIKGQKAPKHFIIIRDSIEVVEGDKSVCVHPDNSYKISCNIDFQHPLIGVQKYHFDHSKDNFEDLISPARTFGFIKDLEYLKMFSLGKGGGLDNAIIIDKDRILNEDGLRFKDEFVRHKLLDCLGDFALLGMPILGHIVTHKSGHALNHMFIKKLLEQKNSWETGPALIDLLYETNL